MLAVDQTARTDDSEPVVVRAVTLEMDPKESEILTKSMAEGTIQLTLRNPNDDQIMVAEEAPKPRAESDRAASGSSGSTVGDRDPRH